MLGVSRMNIWDKIIVVTKNNERNIFKNVYLKIRNDDVFCVESDSGEGNCFPEINIKRIVCIRSNESD